MAYNENTPVDINETFSVSQPKITANFQAIKILVDKDHETFDIGDEGKHKKVTLTEQAAAPADLVGSKDITLYTKDNAGTPNVYMRFKDNGTEYNMTPSAAGHTATGYEVLPSGLILKWGLTTATGVTTITYPVGAGIPAFGTFVLSVQLTPYGTDAGNMNREIRLKGYGGVATFDVVATRRYANNLDTCEFIYLAIGY